MRSSVSIIIPCQRVTNYLLECIEHCLVLNYPQLEIIVLPDFTPDVDLNAVTIIPTGKVSPGEKRDIGAKQASGELLAFIDDDAYPHKEWLAKAVGYLESDEVAAVAGPAVTPPSDSLLQRASGFVYSSFLGSGSKRYRYIPQKRREVDDYPSCNLIVRKLTFEEIGGFDTKLWPGEDTKFCLELTKKLGKKIIYDPEVLVYHHRRKLFIQHLKQVWSYAIHRGYFIKRFPQTSRKVFYFLPSLFLLCVVSIIIASVFSFTVLLALLSLLILYSILVMASSLKSREWKTAPLIFLGIISMHITYGLGFLKGLCTKELVR